MPTVSVVPKVSVVPTVSVVPKVSAETLITDENGNPQLQVKEVLTK